MHPFAIAAFWIGLGVLAYTFLGYRLLIAGLSRLRPRIEPAAPAGFSPEICAVIVACNEEPRIVARVENLLASTYPGEKLRVLVVSDGSTDATLARVQALADPRVEALALPERGGKASGLNAALRHSTAEIVVFTDARQQFGPETIARLAAHFAQPQVGAVSGSLEIRGAQSNAGRGLGAYWAYEKGLRADEARWDSCIGCTGAVYAIRRALFRPIPADTVLDDVVIPMQIAAEGYRILHDPQAMAYDPQPLEPAAERSRKRRTLAGNFQMLFRHPGWLLPGRSRLWWQLLSHKYLRLTMPLWLVMVFAANLALLGQPLYSAALLVQFALYGCACAGLCLPKLQSRVFALPAAFVFLSFSTLQALWHYLRSPALHRWQPAEPVAHAETAKPSRGELF